MLIRLYDAIRIMNLNSCVSDQIKWNEWLQGKKLELVDEFMNLSTMFTKTGGKDGEIWGV